jgi:hypothetical protein
MTETTVRLNLDVLSKEGATEIAKALGLRRDWMRVKKGEILTMLRAFPAERVLEAARGLPDFFDEEDLDNLTTAPEAPTDDAPPAEEAIEAEPLPEPSIPAPMPIPAPAPATPPVAERPAPLPAYRPAAEAKPAPKAPDVSQVAALLAQLLATGKAGLDADEVRGIVEPMVMRHADATLKATASVVDEKLASTTRDLLDTVSGWIKEIPAREIVVKTERSEVKVEGLQHFKFETLLRVCSARQHDGHRLNVWLYGPPGTGKTTAAANVAKALDLQFYCTGALMSKYDLTGFIDATGKTVRSTFREAWENGGVYLFDEIDGSAPQAIVAFNAALANGVMAFPDGMVPRHHDCVIIAAANTSGLGATADFVGRMKLDAASLDRFVMIDWPIDENIERAMCSHSRWAETVQAFRRRVAEKGVKGIMVTPRATMFGSSLLDQGIEFGQVKTLVLRKGLTEDQWAALN